MSKMCVCSNYSLSDKVLCSATATIWHWFTFLISRASVMGAQLLPQAPAGTVSVCKNDHLPVEPRAWLPLPLFCYCGCMLLQQQIKGHLISCLQVQSIVAQTARQPVSCIHNQEAKRDESMLNSLPPFYILQGLLPREQPHPQFRWVFPQSVKVISIISTYMPEFAQSCP